MPNTFDVTDEREAVGGEEGAGQQQIRQVKPALLETKHG